MECKMKRVAIVLSVALSASAVGAMAKDQASQAFLKKAIEGNYAEVQMGQLAQQNAQNDDVKKFGKTLTDDHSAANQKALDAASKLGMTAPTEANAKAKAEYEKMSKLTGAAFDRMFARHMVEDHQKDLADYKKEAKQKDAAGEYASGEVDVLQKHLDTAKALRVDKSASK
jgi:predicted outer membrane protein